MNAQLESPLELRNLLDFYFYIFGSIFATFTNVMTLFVVPSNGL